MKKRANNRVSNTACVALARLVVVLTITCVFFTQALAQQTPADTQIQNTASATYSDGSGGSYSTNSNTVTVIVSKVSGLTITPDVVDGSSNPTVVPGQNNVSFAFTVTNTGNFTDNVRFKAGGASVYIASGSASVASAFIDVNTNGSYQAGTDIDIFTNGADVVSPNVAQNGSLSVVVFVNINAGAAAGSIIDVRLGDTAGGTNYDNQASDGSPAEVRSESNASVNGRREARGDRSAIVENDAQLSLGLTAPAGPVALGSNITYTWQLCNIGARTAVAITLANAPGGSNTGVFVFAPTPVGTTLAAQAFPAGTLYSDSPVTDDPVTTAQWYAAPPANVTRIAFNIGNSLAGSGACSANLSQVVTITTTDATNAITQQGTASANNSIGARINATSPLRTTLLIVSGSVLNGPQGQPGAVNNTNNDDFTNKSVSTGIAGVAPGGNTNASGVVNFTNTLQNTGNANDSYTLTVQSFPAGSTVRVTVNAVQTTVVLNGIATGNAIPALAIAYNATANYSVEVTLPIGMTVLTGYDTVIRATSGNTNTQWNETIDRVYTGFIQLSKSAVVNNATGVGGANDAVPGAVITYSITYQNVSSAAAGGGNGNVQLTATNVVITEDGNAGTNNWATWTDHVVGATDSLGGTIVGDAVASVLLTDTIASLAPQTSGVFTFKRQIK